LGYSAGIGYDFGDHWRVELDADHLDTDFGSISQTDNSSADLFTDTLMINALYDFDEFGDFEPGYKISENLTWDTHYTYLNAPDLDLAAHVANVSNGVFENGIAEFDDVAAHTLMTGLRYRFGHNHTPVLEVKAPNI